MPHAIDLHVSSINIGLMFCIETVQEATELRLQFILGLDAIQIELVMRRLIVLLKLTDERDDVPLDAIGVSDFVLIVKILLDIDLVEEIPCDVLHFHPLRLTFQFSLNLFFAYVIIVTRYQKRHAKESDDVSHES